MLHGNTNKAVAAKWLAAQNADVITLLEVSSEWQHTVQSALPNYPYQIWDAHDDHNFGIALLSRFPLDGDVIASAQYPIFSSIRATMHWQNKDILLIAAHPPPPLDTLMWQAQQKIITLLNQERSEFANMPQIVMGDLNASATTATLRQLTQGAAPRLHDSRFGLLNGSWGGTLPAPFRLDLDHILLSPDWQVSTADLGPDLGSDHLPLLAKLSLN